MLFINWDCHDLGKKRRSDKDKKWLQNTGSKEFLVFFLQKWWVLIENIPKNSVWVKRPPQFLYIKVFGNFTFSSGSNCNCKKSIIWFIMRSPAKFQPPNPSIKASKCISRFWSFGRFVWKSKKLSNFFIFDIFFTFLFWILIIWVFKSAPRWVFTKFVISLGENWILRKFRSRFCMENSINREFRGIRLKIMWKLFNYDQKTNSLAF